MRNEVLKYTVTNRTTGIKDFEFEGTAIDFAHAYGDNIYGIRDIGYASDIHDKYKNLLDNNKFSEEHTQELVSKIEALSRFDKDTVIFTNINYREPLISSDFNQLNSEFSISVAPQKNKLVSQIESLGYTLQATSQQDRKNRIYLVDDGNRIAHVDFMSNVESIRNVRAKLSGDAQFRDNTYLSGALKNIYATALAHSMVNDRLATSKIEALVDNLPSHYFKIYCDSLEKFGGKVKKEVKTLVVPEKETFYLIHAHAKSVALTDGKPVQFTNEFVGTEREFNEYKATYGQKRNMEAVIVKVETFAPEFRNTHREIEKILLAYKNGSGDKAKMLETLKGFDNTALLRLEDRLKESGIKPEQFQKDFSDMKPNKPKPKM